MNARTELIALLACIVPLGQARDMVDRHHAEVAEDTKRAAAVQAMGALPMPTGDVEDPCRPCGCPKRFDRHAYGCPTIPEDRHDSPLRTDYATPRDLPEIPAQRDRGTGL